MPNARDVLVVDDDPDMVEAIMMVLEQGNYQARSAENGRQALAEVDKRLPGLILLDMLMPVMDGWQFAKELRARYDHTVPIVVVTAAEHVKTRGDEVGADDVLSKPFNISSLLGVVGRYLPTAAVEAVP
jgi:DNA-binding response OmpR family regulator